MARISFDGEDYRVWTSIPGGMYGNGQCTAHLVNPGTGRTFCGKKKGRMTTRWNQYDPTFDCKRCTQAVVALEKRKGATHE